MINELINKIMDAHKSGNIDRDELNAWISEFYSKTFEKAYFEGLIS